MFTVAPAPTEVGFTVTLVMLVVCAQAEADAIQIKKANRKQLNRLNKKLGGKPDLFLNFGRAKEWLGIPNERNSDMKRNKL